MAAETQAPRDIPGMNPGGSALPSADPALGADTFMHYVEQQKKQMTDQMRSYMLFSGEFSHRMRDAIKQVDGLMGDVQRMRADMAQSPSSSATVMGGTGARPAPGGASAGSPMQPPGPAPASSAPPEGGNVGPASASPMTFSEGRQIGSNARMGDVSQRLARAGAQALSTHGHQWAVDEATDTAHLTDRQGNVIRSVSNYSQNPEAQQAVARAGVWAGRRNLVTGALGRYGAGEGISGALGGSVARFAGPVGVAVGAADQVFRRVADQTAQGAQWRQIYGEDAGRFAISQRSDQWMAGMKGYFSGIGSGRAKEGYAAMAQLGLSGDALDNATDFDKQMYLSHGMDAQESAQFVDMARKTNTSLGDLTEQLDKVSKSAVAAGQSSQQAAEQYKDLANALASGVSNTSSASTAAGDIKDTLSKLLPTSMSSNEAIQQGVAGAATSPAAIQQAALASGVSYSEMATRLAAGGQGAIQQVVGGSIQKALEQICANLFQQSPEDVAAAYKKTYGDAKSPENYIAFMHSTGADQKNPQLVIPQIFSAYGVTIPTGDVMSFFFETLLQNVGEAITGPEGGGEGGSGGASTGSALQQGGYNSLKSEADKKAAASYGPGATSQTDPLAEALYGMGTGAYASTMPGYSTYKSWAEKSGNRDSAVEGLISGDSAKDFEKYAGKSASEATFHTSQGDKSLEEILSDPGLLQEFDSGTVTVSSGSDKNTQQSVSEFTHFNSASAPAGSSGSTAAGSGYTLALTPEAAQIFKLLGPSDAQRAGVPAAGLVSPNTYGR